MARPLESEVQTGLLLIADVSGYTAYLSGVELEHSHDILADLVGAVAHSLAGRFEVIEVEGDAVFVHHLGEDLAGVEAMTVAERCYLAFAQRRDMIRLGSTCSCRACGSIDSLDLKFVMHHGQYVCRPVAGANKLVGPDVVVVHRLLKNAVAEDLGTRAYVLFTAAAAALGLDATEEGLVPVELAYDDVGLDAPGPDADAGHGPALPAFPRPLHGATRRRASQRKHARSAAVIDNPAVLRTEL